MINSGDEDNEGSYFQIDETYADYQFAAVNLPQNYFIRGVYILTSNEDNGATGTLHFAVDDVECIDDLGAGVNGFGGAFNCNRYG